MIESTLALLKKHWFVCGIGCCLLIGSWPPPGAESVFDWLSRWMPSHRLTAIVLFFMSITLPLKRFGDVLKKPIGLACALLTSLVVMPLLACGLGLLQLTAELQLGLLIVGVAPTTLASASVWTRHANGNDAIPLCNTLLTNGLCFLTIPFWLGLLSGTSLKLDFWDFGTKLLLTAVLPMFLGQLIRWPAAIGRIVDHRKTLLSVIAQLGLLLIVMQGMLSYRNGTQSMPATETVSLNSVYSHGWMMICCGLLHLTGLWLAIGVMRLLKQPAADQIGTGFSGSQKTLPIALQIATTLQLIVPAAGTGLLLVPLSYHVLQLILDSIVVMIWNRNPNRSS